MRDHHLELLERRRRRRYRHRDDGGGGSGGEGGSVARQRRRCWNAANVLATTALTVVAMFVSNWAGVNCQGELRCFVRRGSSIYLRVVVDRLWSDCRSTTRAEQLCETVQRPVRCDGVCIQNGCFCDFC